MNDILMLVLALVGIVVVVASKNQVIRLVAGIVIFTFAGRFGYDSAVMSEKILTPTDISVYHAVSEQTDSSPLITADGSIIDPQNIQQWAAISRDNLATYPFGSQFVVRCKCPYDSTTWTVHDVMHSRYTSSIDLLVPETEVGKWEGIIYKP